MNTCSLEVSKKLKEAGLDIESGYVWDLSYNGEWELVHSWEHGGYHRGKNSTNAYQIHEILEQLPAKVTREGREYALYMHKSPTGSLSICYIHKMGVPEELGLVEESIGIFVSQNPHDALALLWVWLKENGYLDKELKLAN